MKSRFFNLPLRFATALCLLLLAMGHPAFGSVTFSGDTSNSDTVFVGNTGAGTLTIDGGSSLSSSIGWVGYSAGSTGTVNVSGGTWANSSNLAVGLDGIGSLTINGTGTVIVGDTLSRGSNGTINLSTGGTLQIGTGGATGTLATDLTNNGALIFYKSSDYNHSYEISGAGSVIKNGSGTLVFTGYNTYTGGTSVNDGTLYLQTDLFAAEGALFSMGNLTIASGATLMSERGNLAGNLTLNGGTWVENNGFGGSWSGSVSLGATSTFQSDYYQTVTANITGTGGLTKTGSGVLTLTGANTYSGNTTVSAGTLNVNGSTSASSSFTVASGATLGGNGTIGGATMIYGIHSPGSSPGIQTFTGNLTYDTSGGSIPTVNWQLSGNTDTDFSAFDLIVVGGNLAFNTPTSLVLDFSGYGDVDWADSFWDSNQSWVIYDVAGTTTGAGNLTIATANWADNSGDSFDTLLTGSAFSLGLQGNDLVLNYTAGTSAVPEPGQVAASLLLLSGIGIYLWRKKHTAQATRLRS